jgi:hypothetical protein
MKRLRLAIACICLSACGGGTLETLPLAINVTAAPTAAVGDTVSFVVNVQGSGVVGIDADFGDGTSDAVQIPFARTARNTFKHVYATAGGFSATFGVTQSDSVSKSATATVQVH